MTTTQDYVVAGMTCEHCTQAVTEEELSELTDLVKKVI